MPLGAHRTALMGVAGVSTADVVLLSSQTADGDSELDFTGLMTSTYGEYIFRFYNINPATDNSHLLFQANAVGASDYNETITSTYFSSTHNESGGDDPALAYEAGRDQAQGTAFQDIAMSIGNGADENAAGELHIFNPSSTVYVKHFYAISNCNSFNEYSHGAFAAGYFNVTAAIDDIQFKMNSGDFDGTIKMWGVK